MTFLKVLNKRVALLAAICATWCGHGAITLVAQTRQPAVAPDAFQIEPPFAWNRSDRFEPPDFETFFPHDVAAGEQLDLMLDGKLKVDDIDERLTLVRRGLRTTKRHSTTLLGSIGNQFIWNREPQDPRAIELMYHASGSSQSELAHTALYHGPTVVSQRTPNLVRALMEQYSSLDHAMQRRIVWGMQTYGDKEHTRKLLLGLLDDHERLSEATICAAVDTYQAVFDTAPPDLRRFENVGQWVIAFHRTDLSADHPRAAKILRESLDHISLRNQALQLIDFVTRVDDGHETGVALVKGLHSRTVLTAFLKERLSSRIDFDEMLSPRTLQEHRLREFARHLSGGLPPRALPSYTRPPADATYAHQARQFVAPSFELYFADDADAAAQLDAVYAQRETITLSDRELLELFRRGVRRSSHTPNELFGWISGAFGWPRDPLLTEILYQAMDSQAPLRVREAAMYYGFGLGAVKTRNILDAMFHLYMAPPYDRTTNGNLRSRILWSVRDHEDDKHHLATRFSDALRSHATLSDEALVQADRAYRQLTEESPPHAADYASRGYFLVLFQEPNVRSVAAAQERWKQRLGESPYLVETRFFEDDGRVLGLAVVRGMAGQKRLHEQLQTPPQAALIFSELLTRELIRQANKDILRDLEKLLP